MVTARFLVDTNVVSEVIRAEPNRAVLSRFHQHRAQLAMAAPAWHELRYGVERLPFGRRRTAIEGFLSTVVAGSIEILPYDDACAGWHAKERARLAATGKSPPLVDGMIASVAVRHGLPLVTRNTADFIAFDGLLLLDWTTPV